MAVGLLPGEEEGRSRRWRRIFLEVISYPGLPSLARTSTLANMSDGLARLGQMGGGG